MGNNNLIKVEVAYARPDEQKILEVMVEPGSTLEAAIDRSGILEIFPEIDLNEQKVGVFGKSRKLTDRVNEGDRVEIYRGLIIDPMDLRRKKADVVRKVRAGQRDNRRKEKKDNRKKKI